MKSRKDDNIYSLMNEFRTAQEHIINEANESNNTLVPYTPDDKIYQDIINAAKEQFSADFTNYPNPLQYSVKDNDVIFNCSITGLNDAKVQFRLRDSSNNGCFIWVEPLQVTDESIKMIQKIKGVFATWRTDLEKESDLKPISLKNESLTQIDNSVEPTNVE